MVQLGQDPESLQRILYVGGNYNPWVFEREDFANIPAGQSLGKGAIDPTPPLTPFPTALYYDTAFLLSTEPKTIKKGMLCPKIAYEGPTITRILEFGKKSTI